MRVDVTAAFDSLLSLIPPRFTREADDDDDDDDEGGAPSKAPIPVHERPFLPSQPASSVTELQERLKKRIEELRVKRAAADAASSAAVKARRAAQKVWTFLIFYLCIFVWLTVSVV
jgi:hypothetical protein